MSIQDGQLKEEGSTQVSTITDRQDDEAVRDIQDEKTDRAVEKSEVFRPEQTTYPEGGARAWLVALGASLAIL